MVERVDDGGIQGDVLVLVVLPKGGEGAEKGNESGIVQGLLASGGELVVRRNRMRGRLAAHERL